MTQFICKKCGKQAVTLDHKFCTNCGNPYDYSTTKMNLAFEHPIYQGILVLREQFSDYYANNKTTKYKYFVDLFSKGATQVMFRFSDLIVDFIDNNYQQNPEMKRVLELNRNSIKSLFFNIIVDGYFAWVAENKVKNRGIGKATALYSESFDNECFSMKNIIYPEVVDIFSGSQNGKHISSEMASIFLTLSIFQGHAYFKASSELKPLERIYDFIQSNFAEAVVGGYAIALVDAKYRQ